MRKPLLPLSLFLVVALAAPLAGAAETQQHGPQDETAEYVVVYDEGATDAARSAIAAAGGQITRENTQVGVATVRAADSDFMTDVASQPGVVGVAHNTTIGSVPEGIARPRLERDAVEKEGRSGLDGPGLWGRNPRPDAEPLAHLQWDMQQINATTDGSYRWEQGDRRVLVGIVDTGVDGSHPDIAPNFAADLSRNFTDDIPVDANGDEIDGPCEEEPDQSCTDPADVDEDGHGTHVASTIGSPINGLGIAGVAPERHPREPAGRARLGLLLPAAHGRRARPTRATSASTSST